MDLLGEALKEGVLALAERRVVQVGWMLFQVEVVVHVGVVEVARCGGGVV